MKRYDPKLVEALLRRVEIGRTDEADGTDYELAQAVRESAVEERCRWSDDADGTWETGCGQSFIVTEGKPDENDMRFCCYCGRRIEQVDYQDPDAPAPGEEGK